MTFTEQRFRDRGHLFLLVSSFNPRAQQFYRHHGYESIGELKDYIVSGHSELIFYKRLP
jgi:ribosomal protein S18 acetylase RimI-like enzyme